MIVVFNVADLVDPADTQKRTYRQINAEKVHGIPVGALVEIVPDEDEPRGGARAFVVSQGRDCDETPLYWLALDAGDNNDRHWCGGFPEESLKVITAPD